MISRRSRVRVQVHRSGVESTVLAGSDSESMLQWSAVQEM